MLQMHAGSVDTLCSRASGAGHLPDSGVPHGTPFAAQPLMSPLLEGRCDGGGVLDSPARTARAIRRRCQSAVLISTCEVAQQLSATLLQVPEAAAAYRIEMTVHLVALHKPVQLLAVD